MKIEFELPDEYKDKKLVILPEDDPSPIAYINLYDPGDVWLKIKGCLDCSTKNRITCCGTCAMSLKDTGECRLHMGNKKNEKPFYCVMRPLPITCLNWCSLEYKCISGLKKGKIRNITKPRDIFND